MEIVTLSCAALVAAVSAAATITAVHRDGYHRIPTRRP
jgi:hypothetical protein